MEKTAEPKLPEVIAEALEDVLTSAKPVGSRVTCDPAPTNTDEDWLVLVREVPIGRLQEAGFGQEGSPEFYTGNDAGGFRSWRKGEINLITTQSDEFFRLFLTATYLAKRFNLLRKPDRIALFQAILYGVEVHNLEPEPWTPDGKHTA